MSFLPQQPIKIMLFAFMVWLTGFLWGVVVYSIPILKNIKPIEFISSNLFISIPIIIIWIVLVNKLTKKYIAGKQNIESEVVKFGLYLFMVCFLLDLFVLVIGFNVGFHFFLSLCVWIAYATLIIIPLYTAKSIKPSHLD